MKPHLFYSFICLFFLGAIAFSKGYNSPQLLTQYNNFKKATGCNFIITSGWRSEAHNKAVGGSKKSFHMSGKAYDLVPTNSCFKTNLELFNIAKKYFNGVILYKDHIHVDVGNRVYYKIRK